MVSESCLKLVGCNPNVCFRFVIVSCCYFSFVDFVTLACRQWPWVGHCFWFLQLQRRESFVLVGFVCWLCFSSIVLLCRLINDFMFSLQL